MSLPSVDEILLDSADFSRFRTVYFPNRNDKALGNLGKINIFVGANNAGKSRLLRGLASTERLKITSLSDRGPISFSNRIILLLVDLEEYLGDSKERYRVFLNELCKDGARNWMFEDGNQVTALKDFRNRLSQTRGKVPTVRAQFPSRFFPKTPDEIFDPEISEFPVERDTGRILTNLNQQIDEYLGRIESNSWMSTYKISKTFIPSFRSLRRVDLKTDHLFELFKDEYQNNGVWAGKEVFTGHYLFEQFTNHLLGSYDARVKIDRFQSFISRTFFDGQRVTVIPKPEDQKLHLKVGSEEEYPFHLLGDGIQQIILMMFPIFMGVTVNELHFIFIDEPELSLHPGYQRIFIDAILGEDLPNCKIFLTTHSNHFLDYTLDHSEISIFSFDKCFEDQESERRVSTTEIQQLSRGDFRALELLGIRNSSVFLSNCTIWVEGITDRKYFAHWLKLYLRENPKLKHFREDLHYSFVEYAGSNIDHWNFSEGNQEETIEAQRVCSKVMVIADKDDVRSQPKRSRHERLKIALGEGKRYHRLPVREIENMLTPQTIRAVLVSYGENEDEIGNFSQSEYGDEYLGRFIDEKILGDKRKRKGSYWRVGAAAGSGTIRDKSEFCRRAISQMTSYEELSKEAKSLTKSIYDFIKDQNR